MTENFLLNYANYDYRNYYITLWLRELKRKSAETYNFGGLWVRIQAWSEKMSVIFFCADFLTFSYLKLASDGFGGIHKQYGPKRERGRLFYPMYLVTWFIVPCITNNSCLLTLGLDNGQK